MTYNLISVNALILNFWFFLFFIFCKFGLQGEHEFYLVGRDLSGLLKQKFQKLVGEGTATPQEVEVVMGRTLHVCTKFDIAETHLEHRITIIINFKLCSFASSGSIGS